MTEHISAEIRVTGIDRPAKPPRSGVLRVRTWLHAPALAAAVVFAQPTPATLAAGLPLLVLALLLRTWALGHIRKDRFLCVDGPYSLLRHPLYLGNLMVMSGLLIVAWSPVMAAGAILVAALNYRAVIAEEERWLARRFGDEWRDYAARVPRMVPLLRRPTGGFSLRHAVSNKADLSWLAVGAATMLLMLKPWLRDTFSGAL